MLDYNSCVRDQGPGVTCLAEKIVVIQETRRIRLSRVSQPQTINKPHSRNASKFPPLKYNSAFSDFRPLDKFCLKEISL